MQFIIIIQRKLGYHGGGGEGGGGECRRALLNAMSESFARGHEERDEEQVLLRLLVRDTAESKPEAGPRARNHD